MLGIDVKDTKEVKIKDAKFTIGVVSYATRLNLTKTSISSPPVLIVVALTP